MNFDDIGWRNQPEFSRPPDKVPDRAHAARATCSHGLSRRALSRAHAFMEDHLGDPFTLADLADAACVSRFHFARSFRVSTGDSPMAYVLRYRVERAKELLKCSRRTISDTAADLGFFDHSHFTRSFRRLTGFSPRQYARLWDDVDGDISKLASDAAMLRMANAGVVPVTTNTLLSETHRTWNRKDSASWGALYAELVPPYRAVAQSYQRAQEAAK